MSVSGEGHFLMRISDEQRAELALILVEELGAPKHFEIGQLYRSHFPAFGGQSQGTLLGSDPPLALLEFADDDKSLRQAALRRANERIARLVRDWGFELFPDGAPLRGRPSGLAVDGPEL